MKSHSRSALLVEEVPNLASGALIYLPAGEQGILINFGGYNATAGLDSNSGWPLPSSYAVINVYDIASHTWWAQEASGDMPPDYLCQFCAGAAISPDDGAFHITVYGGFSLLEERSYETVYTLSLPSFTWINATTVSDQTNAEQQVNGTIGRDQQSCQMYNGAQLVVLGGNIRALADSLTDGACSQVFSPVRALDLSTYTWQTSFDPSVSFQVPSVIYNVIGGDANGGATQTEPSSGWADPKLASVMKQRAPRATSTSSPTTTPTSTTTPITTPTPQAPHSNTAAIVGGVVGGLAALAILAGAAWFLWLTLRNRNGRGKEGNGYGHVSAESKSPVEMEGRHLGELHGDHRPLEADTTHVYEMAGKRQAEPSELPGMRL
ncbi:hypothetical protein B0A55_13273 [Friedmanniomyces simplex]|uniref:Kelch repeat protein n=1 Tax=Friedmanniomyces simplex TaxID=329884 RepID=A0A4U0VDS2_9PEZI|nr:hypothetical protein B0A55_13273 [Friedmanniomyces simplex]